MRPVIIVFAKAPRAGFVKTRLVPAVSAEDAAALYSAFVSDTLRNLLDFDSADVELHTDMKTDAWAAFPFRRQLQHEGDLGLKMLHALATSLDANRPRALILGSDAPDLPDGYLPPLLDSAADIALGPCPDGGYYAISARRTHPEMFRGVVWSSGFELAQTAAACRACGLTVECGREWHDVDTPADLGRLTNNERAAESAATLQRVRICLE